MLGCEIPYHFCATLLEMLVHTLLWPCHIQVNGEERAPDLVTTSSLATAATITLLTEMIKGQAAVGSGVCALSALSAYKTVSSREPLSRSRFA